MANLDYTVSPLGDSGDMHVVALEGSVDAGTLEDFQNIFDTLIAEEKSRLAFDFRNLKYINSSGMGMMVQYADRFGDLGGKVVLLNVPAKVMLFMEMVGLQEIFDVVNDTDSAIASLSEGDAEAPAEADAAPAPKPKKPKKKAEAPSPKKKAAAPAAKSEGGACGHCGATLSFPGAGRYRCPRCRSLLEVDENMSAVTYPEVSAVAAEFVVPADPEYLESLQPAVVLSAAGAGLEDAAAEAFANAVKAVGSYMVFEALGGDAQERLHVFVGADGVSVSARIYCAGEPLPLGDADPTSIPELAAAAAAADGIRYESTSGGNLIILEKSAE